MIDTFGEVQAAIKLAHKRGAEAERAAIVRFLRLLPSSACNRAVIARIEAGHHLQSPMKE